MSEQRPLIPDATAEDFDSLVGRDLGGVPEEKWARTLVESIEVLETTFVRQGYDEADAFKLASAGVLALAEYRGGRQFYLPRGDALRAALRDAEIYRVANRSNIEALGAEYGLTVSQIYRIVRQQRALHIRKVQGRLFPEEG